MTKHKVNGRWNVTSRRCVMGKDRQEKKLKQSRRTESDRDQSLSYPGSTMLEGPEESRKRNQ